MPSLAAPPERVGYQTCWCLYFIFIDLIVLIWWVRLRDAIDKGVYQDRRCGYLGARICAHGKNLSPNLHLFLPRGSPRWEGSDGKVLSARMFSIAAPGLLPRWHVGQLKVVETQWPEKSGEICFNLAGGPTCRNWEIGFMRKRLHACQWPLCQPENNAWLAQKYFLLLFYFYCCEPLGNRQYKLLTGHHVLTSLNIFLFYCLLSHQFFILYQAPDFLCFPAS